MHLVGNQSQCCEVINVSDCHSVSAILYKLKAPTVKTELLSDAHVPLLDSDACQLITPKDLSFTNSIQLYNLNTI